MYADGREQSGWKSPQLLSSHDGGSCSDPAKCFAYGIQWGKGADFGDPWKIYNNTFIIGESEGTDLRLGLYGEVNKSNSFHEVYNNIFVNKSSGSSSVDTLRATYNTDGKPIAYERFKRVTNDRFLFGPTKNEVSPKEVHDGNVYFSENSNPSGLAGYREFDSHLEFLVQNLLPADNNFSIDVIVKVPSLQNLDVPPGVNESRLMSSLKSQSNAYFDLLLPLTGGSSGKPSIKIAVRLAKGATGKTLVSSKRIDDNNWHRITAVLDKANNLVFLYIDGENVGNTPSVKLFDGADTASYTFTPSIDGQIAAVPVSIGENFQGQIFSARIYKKILQQSDLAWTAQQRVSPQVIDPANASYWEYRSALGTPGQLVYQYKYDPKLKGGDKSFDFFGFNAFQVYANLEKFKNSNMHEITKISYPSGWDLLSIEANPHLDRNYVPDPSGPASVVGVDLKQKNWPGVEATNFRGAIDPNQMCP